MNDFVIHAMLRNISAKMESVTKNADSLDKSDEKIKTATDYFNESHRLFNESHNKFQKTHESFRASLDQATLATQQLPAIVQDFKNTTNSFKKLVKVGWALIGAIAIGAIVTAKAHAIEAVQVINSTNTPVNASLGNAVINVAGTFSAGASTSTVPIGFVVGTTTLTVSAINALPISGSFTASASTASVPTGFLVGTATKTVSVTNPLPVQDTGTLTVQLTTSTNKVGNIDFYAIPGTIFSTVTVNTANTGTTVIVSTVASQNVFVYRMFFTVGNSSTTIQIKNGSGFSFSGPMKFNDGGSFVVDYQGDPWFVTDAGTSFEISQTGTAQISGRVYYMQGTTTCNGGICSAGAGSSQ